MHRLTGETVAVKICAMGEDRLAAESIALEVEMQRALIHRNIAQVYEVVEHEGRVHIFMEYCSKGELYERIDRHGPMDEREAASIAHQILSALIYLKANRLSHRDVKPENVLFDAEGNAKLIDFGFCCRNRQGKGMRNTVCGTPSYTPPEVVRKTAYDPELVDVWSFGVTLYAMVAGHLPF